MGCLYSLVTASLYAQLVDLTYYGSTYYGFTY